MFFNPNNLLEVIKHESTRTCLKNIEIIIPFYESILYFFNDLWMK